jgi:hypothetical protein
MQLAYRPKGIRKGTDAEPNRINQDHIPIRSRSDPFRISKGNAKKQLHKKLLVK